MSRELEAFVDAWRIAGPELEAMRDRALIATPLPEAMDQLTDMIESALFLRPPAPTSGLEQMQAVFARLRR